jgi:hypothetical protein
MGAGKTMTLANMEHKNRGSVLKCVQESHLILTLECNSPDQIGQPKHVIGHLQLIPFPK